MGATGNCQKILTSPRHLPRPFQQPHDYHIGLFEMFFFACERLEENDTTESYDVEQDFSQYWFSMSCGITRWSASRTCETYSYLRAHSRYFRSHQRQFYDLLILLTRSLRSSLTPVVLFHHLSCYYTLPSPCYGISSSLQCQSCPRSAMSSWLC
jgi:hypothetical protein